MKLSIKMSTTIKEWVLFKELLKKEDIKIREKIKDFILEILEENFAEKKVAKKQFNKKLYFNNAIKQLEKLEKSNNNSSFILFRQSISDILDGTISDFFIVNNNITLEIDNKKVSELRVKCFNINSTPTAEIKNKILEFVYG